MAVFRLPRTGNFTTMANVHLRDRGLSLKAKGLLSLMLSLPEEWDYTLSGLACICKECKDTIRSTILELERMGYVRRKQVVINGRFCGNEYYIYESPQEPEAEPAQEAARKQAAETKNPAPKKPYPKTSAPNASAPKKTAPKSSTQLNTDTSKKEKTNTDSETIHPSTPAGADGADGISERGSVWSEYWQRLDMDGLLIQYPDDREQLLELLELIVDTVRHPAGRYRIGGVERGAAEVRERFRSLTGEHLVYVIHSLEEQAGEVRNLPAYLRSALFHAPVTMNSYYAARVGRDLRAGFGPPAGRG